jgi:hypothetical protein
MGNTDSSLPPSNLQRRWSMMSFRRFSRHKIDIDQSDHEIRPLLNVCQVTTSINEQTLNDTTVDTEIPKDNCLRRTKSSMNTTSTRNKNINDTVVDSGVLKISCLRRTKSSTNTTSNKNMNDTVVDSGVLKISCLRRTASCHDLKKDMNILTLKRYASTRDVFITTVNNDIMDTVSTKRNKGAQDVSNIFDNSMNNVTFVQIPNDITDNVTAEQYVSTLDSSATPVTTGVTDTIMTVTYEASVTTPVNEEADTTTTESYANDEDNVKTFSPNNELEDNTKLNCYKHTTSTTPVTNDNLTGVTLPITEKPKEEEIINNETNLIKVDAKLKDVMRTDLRTKCMLIQCSKGTINILIIIMHIIRISQSHHARLLLNVFQISFLYVQLKNKRDTQQG